MQGFEDAQAGRLPEFPTMEIYFHTTVDPSIAQDTGLHSSALFVQWVPHEIQGSSWEAEEEAYVQHLLSVVDRFAPGVFALTLCAHVRVRLHVHVRGTHARACVCVHTLACMHCRACVHVVEQTDGRPLA